MTDNIITQMWHPATLGEIRCIKQRHGVRRIELVMRGRDDQLCSHYVDIPADVDGIEALFDAIRCTDQLLMRMRKELT